MNYHVEVSTMIIDDDTNAQTRRELGRKSFSADTVDEAEEIRRAFQEVSMEHEYQSTTSTMWYEGDKEWIEMGTLGWSISKEDKDA
jgi:hypothetical protein